MKTPEQIAKAGLERIGLDSVDDIDDWGHLERIVALVIEADRAQRETVPEGKRKLTIITGGITTGKTRLARALKDEDTNVIDEADRSLFPNHRNGVLVLSGDWEVQHLDMEEL